MFRKTPVFKISEDTQKIVFGKVLLSSSSCLIYHQKLYWILTPSQMFLLSVPRIFRIVMRASCGETTSEVVCEISAFYNFLEISITSIIGIFRKVVFLKILKNSLLTIVTSLKHTGILLKANSIPNFVRCYKNILEELCKGITF